MNLFIKGEKDVQIYVALCKKEIASLPFSLINHELMVIFLES